MSVTVTKHLLINSEWTPVQDWGQCAEFVLTGTQADIDSILARDEHQVKFPYVPGPYLDGSCASAGFTTDDMKGFKFDDYEFKTIEGRRDYFNKPSNAIKQEGFLGADKASITTMI